MTPSNPLTIQPVHCRVQCFRAAHLRGFTLLEMLVVLAVVAILATLAVPASGYRTIQKQVVESVELVDVYKLPLEASLRASGKFAPNNKAAGMPDADKIIGNYLQSVTVKSGAMHLTFGRKFPESQHGKVLSIRPVYVEDSLASPVSWICGYDEVPAGMIAAGENRTDLDIKYLPLRCR